LFLYASPAQSSLNQVSESLLQFRTDALRPMSGFVGGGTVVTLTGSLSSSTFSSLSIECRFGNTASNAVNASSILFDASGTGVSVVCITPASDAGVVSVFVRVGGGNATFF